MLIASLIARRYAYFEYPSLIAMLLREVRCGLRLGFSEMNALHASAHYGARPPSPHQVRYGLRLGFSEVALMPSGVDDFTYSMGNVRVRYSHARISIAFPGEGARAVVVGGLPAGAQYHVVRCDGSAALATVDDQGVLRFDTNVHEQCTTQATRV